MQRKKKQEGHCYPYEHCGTFEARNKSSLSRVQPLSEDDRSANSQQAMDSVVASGESTNLISATISNFNF